MAITSSAKKAHRASLRRRVFNLRRKNAAKDVVSKIKKLVAEKKGKDAMKLLSLAYKAIDKGAKEHTWNKAAAARKKSRIARLVAKIS